MNRDIFFEASVFVMVTARHRDSPLQVLGEEGSKKGFSCTANTVSESEEAGGRGGRVGGERASTYYIPTVSTVTFHNHNSWGKCFTAKAGGGRTALWMQLERDSSPSTCGSPSGGLRRRG